MEIETGTWNDSLIFAAASDIGMRRGNNQDAYVVALASSQQTWRRRGHLFCVADGMGAHAAGELASQMAVENVPHSYNKTSRQTPPSALRGAISEANRLIHLKGEGSIGFHGMGTTCSAIVLLPDRAFVAHVGDSRIYLLRGHTIQQVTFDHSLVWELAEAGQINDDDLPSFVPKNIITRSLGPHPSVEIDLEGPFFHQSNDTFLLCSDGLTGSVTDVEIGTILKCLLPADAVQTLLDLANLRGGPDNITAVVAKVLDSDKRPQKVDPVEQDAGASRTRRSVHPVALGVVVVLLALALTFVALRNWVAASVVGVGILLTTLFAALQRVERRSSSVESEEQYGRGPYRSYDCSPNDETLEKLAEVVAGLRDVANSSGLDIDTESFEGFCHEARSATRNGDRCDAVRKYCCAIRFAMRQIREQRSSDSSIL